MCGFPVHFESASNPFISLKTIDWRISDHVMLFKHYHGDVDVGYLLRLGLGLAS